MGSEKRQKPRQVNIRLTEQELADLEFLIGALEKKDGVRYSLASAIRRAVFHYYFKEHVKVSGKGTVPSLTPAPKRREPVAIPPEDLEKVSQLTHQLGEVGGLLVLLAKGARLEGNPDLHAQAEQALGILRAIQPDLIDVAHSIKRKAARRK